MKEIEIIGNIRHGEFRRLTNPPELILIPLAIAIVLFLFSLIFSNSFLIIGTGICFLCFFILELFDSTMASTWIEYEILPNGKKHILYQGKYRDNGI